MNKNKLKCYRCGNVSPLPNSCRFINVTCNLCTKKGHLSKVCRSTNSQKQVNSLNTVNVLSVKYDKGSNPIKLSVFIENKARADMELDTGSGISAVLLKRFRRIFPDHKIFPPDVQLKTATGEIFKPVGYVEVNVTYEKLYKYM